MSTAAHSITLPGIVTRALQGAAAGIIGGVVFGVLMAMRDMLPMIAMLAGAESAGAGWVVHLAISVGIGALFGLLVPATELGSLLGAGTLYGMVWWLLGPLVIMPAWLGMPLFMFDTNTWLSLMGHVVYGLIVAAALFGFRRRSGHA